jgi:SAM-dependent methyltransferase
MNPERNADRMAPLALNAWLRWDTVNRILPTDVKDVLEVGCGQGGFGVRLAPRYNYLGVEPDPASYAVAAQRLGDRVHNLPIEDLPEDSLFDMVCAFEVLEHFEDDAATLKSWITRLRPGGRLLISVPANQERFGPFDELVGHFRRYNPATMAALLKPLGFGTITSRLYGVPLGYALETARNVVGRRRLAAAASKSADERTAGSGRVMQPKGSRLGTATKLATAPFRLMQRSFPTSGTGMVTLAHYSP